MKAKKIREDIYWVGAIDWDVRNFHGYLTQKGTTYNAYLIIDEKITLIDTVKASHTDEMLKRISSVIDPSKIDIIISNHVEMDHSGALPKMMEIAPNAEIITCGKGEKGLKAHYKQDWNFRAVKSGETLSLGKRSLEFALTPMVHWPDNMVSYMPEEKILFSNDSLGQHYASNELYDDECCLDIVLDEAKKYYANIVLPYSNQVKKELEIVSKMDIELVAPSHGVMWRENIGKIVEKYIDWSSNKTEKRAVIVYDTMWKSTEKMAYAIQEAFDEKGIKSRMLNLQSNHISDIMTKLIDTEYICVGSPVLNRMIMPSVAGFLTYLTGLTPGTRKAISFGSYGWGSGPLKQIDNYFDDAGFDIIESVKINYVPDEAQLNELKDKIKEAIDKE